MVTELSNWGFADDTILCVAEDPIMGPTGLDPTGPRDLS